MRIILIILFPFLSYGAFADTWYFPKAIESEDFHFGDLTIVKTVDTTENQHYPLYSVKVLRKGIELANYRNLTFDVIKPFAEGSMIFAGSNSGLSRFAYFVLDKDGGLLQTKNHSNEIDYCDRSVTVTRRWLPKEIEIREEYGSEKYEKKWLVNVSAKTCDDAWYELFR
ncbi:hypothetical protein HBA55_37025 [Pseudomaricurvus alkylphenolicus]|jgi:hypothetical protein|uniref:hypothetical protein n=1 Tax=Pseudomaricurvus alkylphenolicus TaxID=1306991 RepID=UPI0014201187|nr:hypothetical protein [Pseudomaricurvus alkylphenolicus]NIB45234.1 hypothetical protein [Pseudomaricurvus alkylphenolicus]